METLSKQDLGVFALEFLENLDAEGADEFTQVTIIVLAQHPDGSDEVMQRTSTTDSEANIELLTRAIVVEHCIGLKDAE